MAGSVIQASGTGELEDGFRIRVLQVTHLAPKTFSIGMLGTWHLAPKHIWHLHIRPLRMFGIWDIWPPGMFGTQEVRHLGMLGTRDIRHLGMFGTWDVWHLGCLAPRDVWHLGCLTPRDVWHQGCLAPRTFGTLVQLGHYVSSLFKTFKIMIKLQCFRAFPYTCVFYVVYIYLHTIFL